MNKDNFKLACELTWGGIPIAKDGKYDYKFILESMIFNQTLEKYPLLKENKTIIFNDLWQ